MMMTDAFPFLHLWSRVCSPQGGEACSVTEGVVSRVEAASAGPADSLRVVRKLFVDNSLRLCGSIHHFIICLKLKMHPFLPVFLFD